MLWRGPGAELLYASHADDAFNHLRLIESHFFSLPAMEVAQPHCAVLEPREHECMYCEDVPLHTREDKSFGMKGGELRVLTETSVLRGYAYSRHCPRCKRVYFHDRVAHPPTEAERAAGQTGIVERCAEPRPLLPLTSPSAPTSPDSTTACQPIFSHPIPLLPLAHPSPPTFTDSGATRTKRPTCARPPAVSSPWRRPRLSATWRR